MRRSPEDPISQEAARWVARHDRGLTPEETQEFIRWQAADLRHAAEFAQLASSWNEFGSAKEVAELAEIARDLDRRTAIRPMGQRRAVWGWAISLAAAAGIAVAVGVWRGREPVATEGGTGDAGKYVVPSAARRLLLDDGSVVELRGDSRLQADFTVAERRVTLLRGEACFSVAKNPNRPFIVSAEGITVRAVGTVFSVQMNRSDVEVVVSEGKISLGSAPPQADPSSAVPEPALPIVVAGERAVVRHAATSSIPTGVKVDLLTPVEMDEALSWRDTWLVFDRTPLLEALDAFNRNGSQQLVLADSSLQGRRLDGRFRAGHVEGFVRLLEQTMHLRAERRGEHTIVLLPAP